MKMTRKLFWGFAIFLILVIPISAEDLNMSSNDSGFQPLVNHTKITSTGKSPVTVTTNPTNGYEYVSDQVIVRYNTQKIENAGVLKATILDSNAKIGAIVEEDFSNSGLPGMQVVKIPQTITVDDAIAEYRKNPDVLYAEPNYIYHISVTPNDPFYGNQWGLHNTVTSGADIAAPDAWGISTGSSDVVVAIIDTGVDYNHPDLAANMWTNTGETPANNIDDDGNGYIDDVRGWNFYDNESDPMDEMTYLNTYHGTHCSGIIGAVGNNGVGISGVNWQVKIMPLRVADEDGSLYISDAIVAINYANANGADIISNSWGGLGYSQALKDAITSSPAVVVCAAGNYASSTPERNNDITPIYPASYVSDNIIAVAATDNTDSLASFSHYGNISVDLAAPGVSIYSTNKSSGSTSASYQYMSGTSMATPYVSGVAALIKSVNPQLTNLQIKEIILNNVDVIPSLSGKVNTTGRLNANKSIRAAQGTLEPVVDFSGIPIDGTAPLNVQFTDLTTNNPTVWNWSFGDGNTSGSNLKNPVHTYFTQGNFTVSLNASNAWGSKVSTKVKYINVTVIPPVSDFFAVRTSGIAPVTIRFVDTSQNAPATWNWSFGDGTANSTLQNPVHTYLSPGNYSVSLNVTNSAGFNPRTRIGYINVTTVPDNIGAYQNGVWYLEYNGNFSWDGVVTDKLYNFGSAGNTSVYGDWNGDGKTEIAVYKNGLWYVDYDGDGIWNPTFDKTFWFGATGYTPIVGDWNGDGRTEIAVYQNGLWYVDYDGSWSWTPSTDKTFQFGATGYTPIVGDWNGDGRTEIAIYQNGLWYVDYDGSWSWTPSTDKTFWFGATGYTPIVGKWS